MPSAEGFGLTAYCVPPASRVYFFKGSREVTGQLIVYREADWPDLFRPDGEYRSDRHYKDPFADRELGLAKPSGFKRPKMKAKNRCLSATARLKILEISFLPDDGRKPDTFIEKFAILQQQPYQECKE